MGDKSAIEWTDATYNPWRGCDKVSPGCAHCYMFREQRMYGRDPSVVVRCADGTFFAPVRSKKWRELAPGSLVFTCSWSDWFHEDADPWRDEAWEVLRGRPDLIWQILTKRPERIYKHLPADWGDGWPNVWLGVSVENRRFTDRATILQRIPAAVRFISAEPLLGPIVCPACKGVGSVPAWGGAPGMAGCPNGCADGDGHFTRTDYWLRGIDWVIAGGESGPQHRPMRAEWARDLRDACMRMAACASCGEVWNPPGATRENVCRLCGERVRPAFFFKQWGGLHGKDGGRDLDGRTWDEFPTVREAVTA